MTKLTQIEIICPACKKKTKSIILKNFEENEIKEDSQEKKTFDSLAPPEMSNHLYDVFCNVIEPNMKSSIRVATISAIKSHNLGFLTKRCILSDRMFRVFYYFQFDHKKQTAGWNFVIGKEVQNPSEY